MRHGSVCCKAAEWPLSNNQQRQLQLVNVQRSLKPQAQDVQFPRRTPEETQAMAATKVRRIEAVIAALGEDDGEELATLQSCLRRARLQAQVPPVEKRIADCSQLEEGRGGEHSIAESSGAQASVRRRGGSWREPSRGLAMRSGKVGHCSINGVSIRMAQL